MVDFYSSVSDNRKVCVLFNVDYSTLSNFSLYVISIFQSSFCSPFSFVVFAILYLLPSIVGFLLVVVALALFTPFQPATLFPLHLERVPSCQHEDNTTIERQHHTLGLNSNNYALFGHRLLSGIRVF